MDTAKMPGFSAEASLYRTAGQYLTTGVPGMRAGSPVILPQLANTTYTTDKICAACGCVVKGFGCDCGTPPNKGKVDCINNGGPSKFVGVFGSGVFSGAVQARRFL